MTNFSNKLLKTALALPVLTMISLSPAFADTIVKIGTNETIKVGDYQTVCAKKPKQCGSEADLGGSKPKPEKPTKKISYNKHRVLKTGQTFAKN